MKRVATHPGVFALLLVAGGALAACGADIDGRSAALDESMVGAQALSELPGIDDADDADDEGDDDCDALRGRLQKDAMAVQKTKQFKALAKTKEYKALQADVEKMRDADCDLSGGGGAECAKLRLQVFRDQQAMVNTTEYKALAKTKQFKKMMATAREAMENDCFEGMGMAQTVEPDAAPLMVAVPQI